MMRKVSEVLSHHHGVNILEEAIEASVKLSARYLPARQLPDKSVSLLDTACARVSLSQTSIPASVSLAKYTIDRLQEEIDSLTRQSNIVSLDESHIASLREQQIAQQQRLDHLETQWALEKKLINEIHELRKSQAGMNALQPLYDELQSVQGDSPLIHLDVNERSIASVIENWTGIPAGKMAASEFETILNLENLLSQRVVGQDHAMKKVAEAIRISRSGLMDPRKPLGVFLMVGTSGTGKTETALALTDLLYGGEQNLVTINMSEFKEEHKVSMLLGASAGYVGYGEGGVLTEAVRKNPYSVVLLDEMEKAHPGIQDVFYNLFDKGSIKDGEGRDIDFRNTIIIMTSNAASDTISKYFGKTELNEKELLEEIKPELLTHFRPAFLGRTQIVPYFPLDRGVLQKIVAINLSRISKRLDSQYKASFEYTDEVMELLLAKCQDPMTGARNAEVVITQNLLPKVSDACLDALVHARQIAHVEVSLVDGQFQVEVAG